MNHTNAATTTDALAPHLADPAVFGLPGELAATEGASITEAMATIGARTPPAVAWITPIDDFLREGFAVEPLDEAFDWIGAA